MKRILCAMMFCAVVISTGLAAQAQSAREATIEPETKFKVTLQTQLSSKLSEVGDNVVATIDEPLYVNGEQIVPRGTAIHGRVTAVKAAGRPHKTGQMSIIFDQISMPWGQEPISVVLTSVDDWDNDKKMKADEEGKVSGDRKSVV